jgi:hypothetical protein
MADCRKVGSRFALPCLLLATTALSGCGLQFESIAQSAMQPADAAISLDALPSTSYIFSPCVSGSPDPPANAASAISDLLLGKDQYRTGCTYSPAVNIPLDGGIERAPRLLTPQPVLATPADPPTPGLVVTDELVSAVLTGTGEYWYQPIVGPA